MSKRVILIERHLQDNHIYESQNPKLYYLDLDYKVYLMNFMYDKVCNGTIRQK